MRTSSKVNSKHQTSSLRKAIIRELVAQGFKIENGKICPANDYSKDTIRLLSK